MRHLKTRAQFQAVLAGPPVSRTAHFALHRLELGAGAAPLATPTAAPRPLFAHAALGAAWVGAMTPKRWARRAVTRNCIKRQILHVSANFEDCLKGAAHVVRLRSGFDRAKFVSAASEPLKRAVRSELISLFNRLAAAQAATPPCSRGC